MTAVPAAPCSIRPQRAVRRPASTCPDPGLNYTRPSLLDPSSPRPSGQRCYYRVASAAIAPITSFDDNSNYLLFEVGRADDDGWLE